MQGGTALQAPPLSWGHRSSPIFLRSAKPRRRRHRRSRRLRSDRRRPAGFTESARSAGADAEHCLPPCTARRPRSRDDHRVRGGSPGISLPGKCHVQPRALGPDGLASLPRDLHADGGGLRPADAPPSSGNRPARTADGSADRCLTGFCCCRWPPALPACDVRSEEPLGIIHVHRPARHRSAARQARRILL